MDFKKIEKKWQDKWEKAKVFEAKEGKKKCYVLEMFPYPSSSGLHLGHALNYVIGDIYARYKKMQGFQVLHPMGFDSFGLPAENAAIKAKSHPKKFTEEAIKNYIKQMKGLGISYDWIREIETHKPDYYKWGQWIFLQMLKKGLAYRKKASVNFCPMCNTVLANEQVINGRCWRHEDCQVQVKQLEQWFLKTTEYAEELLSGLDKLDDWSEVIKNLQRNWIGKSEGSEIIFKIQKSDGFLSDSKSKISNVNGDNWKIFTTRADTLFGVTFLVISAQHPRLMDLATSDKRKEVEKFVGKIKSTKQEDMDKLDKEGVFTGSYAEHPLTKEKIPIWAGNFVLADYGSGMVMAVPAHDQRDFEFAKKYGISMKVVVQPKGDKLDVGKTNVAFADYGVLINSKDFDGLESEEAKEHITEVLKKKGLGKKTIQYRLRDWLISRQRFWGTPIPVVYCDKCGIVPILEKNLPVKLPDKIKFKGAENPLKTDKKFLETKCPECGRKATRETDTMDTFANSSWYYLRYADSKNNKEIFNKKKANYWAPIDLYIGGKEHATLHLIYIRFYTKFLRDLGLLKIDEPAVRLFNQGFLLGSDGEKMSKSKGNVILPEVVSEKYGLDAARLFLVSVSSPDKDKVWSDNGAEGSRRFVNKLFEMIRNIKVGKSSKKMEHFINKTIREVEKDIEYLAYNIAAIKLRKMFEFIESEDISKKDLESFVKILSPFCPHISEELWEKMGGKGFVSMAEWPKYDEKKIDDNFDKAEQALEKTVGDILNILRIIKEKTMNEGQKIYLYVLPNEFEFYSEEELTKRVGREIKVYKVNDKDKYDPDGKSAKAKPGKPGIYVE